MPGSVTSVRAGRRADSTAKSVPRATGRRDERHAVACEASVTSREPRLLHGPTRRALDAAQSSARSGVVCSTPAAVAAERLRTTRTASARGRAAATLDVGHDRHAERLRRGFGVPSDAGTACRGRERSAFRDRGCTSRRVGGHREGVCRPPAGRASGSSCSRSRSTPRARSGRPGRRSGTSTGTTSRVPRPVTARPRPATTSSSAGRSGSSATSSSAAESPLADPYSFRPEAEAPPNLQGWLLGVPYWPLAAAFGNVWAYDLIVLLSFLLAGGFACWWLRTLGLSRPAALVGGAVFCLMPYRVGQSTGHLLGLVAFLLPALLLALERRRLVVAALVLCALPLSGQLHLALGAIPLALGYAWARLPRQDWWKAGVGAVGAVAAGLVVERWTIADSIGVGRSFAQVERYSAELTDFVTRSVGSGVEELVFVGWLTPLVALGRAVGGTGPTRARGPARPCGARPVPARAGREPARLRDALARRARPRRDPRPGAPAADRLPRARGARRVRRSSAALTTLVLLQHKLVLPAVVAAALAAARARPPGAGLRRGRGGRAEPRLRGRSAAKAACSSSRCSGLTCTSAAPTSGTRARARASDRRATRPSLRARRAVSRASSEASRAGAARFPRRLGIRFVAVHRGLYDASGFFAPVVRRARGSALRAAGWRLLARDGPIASYAIGRARARRPPRASARRRRGSRATAPRVPAAGCRPRSRRSSSASCGMRAGRAMNQKWRCALPSPQRPTCTRPMCPTASTARSTRTISGPSSAARCGGRSPRSQCSRGWRITITGSPLGFSSGVRSQRSSLQIASASSRRQRQQSAGSSPARGGSSPGGRSGRTRISPSNGNVSHSSRGGTGSRHRRRRPRVRAVEVLRRLTHRGDPRRPVPVRAIRSGDASE